MLNSTKIRKVVLVKVNSIEIRKVTLIDITELNKWLLLLWKMTKTTLNYKITVFLGYTWQNYNSLKRWILPLFTSSTMLSGVLIRLIRSIDTL